jgi:hypothetical protein
MPTRLIGKPGRKDFFFEKKKEKTSDCLGFGLPGLSEQKKHRLSEMS